MLRNADIIAMHRARHPDCRMIQRAQMLDAELILSSLNDGERAHVTQLEVLPEVDSTNLYLMRKAGQGAPSGTICLAEQQYAGRGQRGKNWVSPPACNIYLSVLWQFTPRTTAGLSIAMGVAVARALAAMGIAEVQLKWPNDVMWRGRKLAGILIDMATRPSGEHYAVIGVGLNVAMPVQQAIGIDQPWIDVQGILGRPVVRNHCAGLLVRHLLHALREFQSSGLAGFEQEWTKLDMFVDKQVNVQTPEGIITGSAQGIGADGSFRLLLANGQIRRYQSAEVNVKLDDPPTRTYVRAEVLEQR